MLAVSSLAAADVGVTTSYVTLRAPTTVAGFGYAMIANIFPTVHSYEVPNNATFPSVWWGGNSGNITGGCTAYFEPGGFFTDGAQFYRNMPDSNFDVSVGSKTLSDTQTCDKIPKETWDKLLGSPPSYPPVSVTRRTNQLIPLKSVCVTVHMYNGTVDGAHAPSKLKGVIVSRGCGWSGDYVPATCTVNMGHELNLGSINRGQPFYGDLVGQVMCDSNVDITASIVVPSGGLFLSNESNRSSTMPYSATISLGNSTPGTKATGKAGPNGTPITLSVSGTASVVGSFSDSLVYVISVL